VSPRKQPCGSEEVRSPIARNWTLPFFTGSNQRCRYLTAVNQSYYGSLSRASQKSLALQGGPLRDEELKAFEQDLLKDEMVSLRLWDDAAKIIGIENKIPRAHDYLELIVAHLSGEYIENLTLP
jgi:predicted HD phosphohydrolase